MIESRKSLSDYKKLVSYSQFNSLIGLPPIIPVVKSDGGIRICGDYSVTVNAVSKLDSYPLPGVDDLFTAMSEGKLFTKLDLSHAYQQLLLNAESRNYTTINTPKGLFQYQLTAIRNFISTGNFSKNHG